MSELNKRIVNRRSVLRYTGIGGVAALAGCTGDDGESAGDGSDDSDSTETVDSDGIQMGGEPVVGLTSEPNGFNPLLISDADAWAIMGRFYPEPIVRDPSEPGGHAPFVFSDWDFDPESMEGWATVTDGMEWSDGTSLTADDVAFTFNYLMEVEGHRYEANVSGFEMLEATGNNEIEFSLADEVAAIFTPETGAFAVPQLPEHVWGDVDDFEEYSPDELVGAGGFRWDDSDPGNWYEIEAAPELMPDEIHEGPYVDSLRYQVFGSETALTNALQNGDVDLTYNSITPNRAFQLQDDENVRVWDARSRGYNYVALNMRRTPLDDVRFRQSLRMAFPFEELVGTHRRGLSERGDYAAAAVYEDWRPDGFDDPFDHGPYELEDGFDAESVRSFLEDHGYSFGSVESGQVTGDAEIRINGQTLPEAHTGNQGEGGQGPLEIVVDPPSDSPVDSRTAEDFAENLNEVGIPTEINPTDPNAQQSVIWGQEDFDLWFSGWIWMPNPHFYLNFWLHSSRADMDSTSDSINLNPMAYDGADDLITQVHGTSDPDEQQAVAKEALATIYEDTPAIITEYPNRLHATSRAYDGWIEMPGGISQNYWTYLNVHQADN